jgi:ElaB/YqjD/DUF883 family membrane-anchored ribosome-binding protein
MSEATKVHKDKLMADLQVVLADAEALLAATAHDANAGVAELRGRVQASLANARVDLQHAQEAMLIKAKEVAKATDGYVHENPWKSVGIAAGAGLLLGLLLSRR